MHKFAIQILFIILSTGSRQNLRAFYKDDRQYNCSIALLFLVVHNLLRQNLFPSQFLLYMLRRIGLWCLGSIYKPVRGTSLKKLTFLEYCFEI